ncbi:MAG: C-terminal binding protein [Pseudomonadota bacterium]
MSNKAKVVITDYVWETLDVEERLLGDLATLNPMKVKTEDAFLDAAEDCDALLNTYAGPITERSMARMGNCKIIARYGIGVDTIDLDAATEAGIIVTNNPSYCVEEVADHAMALLLSAARKTAYLDRRVRAGHWAVMDARPLRRLSTTTIGLIGYGNIAREMAKRAAGFGMEVLWSDPFVEEGNFDTPGRKVSLDELYASADFISVHAPLVPSTRGLLGADAFRAMKPSAVVVNCSRGPIIDTAALVAALDAGEIAGAALDTTDPEPLPQDNPLHGRDNVILNPHAAWYSVEAFEGLQHGAPGEVARVLRGERPVNIVNPGVLGRSRAGL